VFYLPGTDIVNVLAERLAALVIVVSPPSTRNDRRPVDAERQNS